MTEPTTEELVERLKTARENSRLEGLYGLEGAFAEAIERLQSQAQRLSDLEGKLGEAEKATAGLAPINADFADELERALRLIASSDHLRGKHTNFNGEIRSMSKIVEIAANLVGRPRDTSLKESRSNGDGGEGKEDVSL